MVFEFKPPTEENAAYAGRRVELQRTRLQHSWATAVEAVGLFRREDMKAGEGDGDWLQLFKLMSAEFALAEQCGETNPGERRARVDEIISLERALNARGVLEDIKNATKYVQEFLRSDSPYFLIVYNDEDRTVKVLPYGDAFSGTSNLDDAERRIEKGQSKSKVVLVEVDKVDALIEAYPNYFGDVNLFVKNLRNICGGTHAIEYTMAPQPVVAPKAYEKPDASWMRQRRKRWFEKKPRG